MPVVTDTRQALFSTTFFTFNAHDWEVSDKFWIYWAITIPATASIVMAYWVFTTAVVHQGRPNEKASPFYVAMGQ